MGRFQRMLSKIPAVRNAQKDKARIKELEEEVDRASDAREDIHSYAQAITSRIEYYGEKNHFSESLTNILKGE